MNTTNNIALSVVDYEKIAVPELIEKENYGGGGFISYGDDNLFPQMLKECYQNCATMSTIVNGYVDYICGDGIEINADLKNFEDAVNRDGMTLEEFIRKEALDLVLFDGYANQIIYSKIGTISELRTLDFSNIRSDKYNERFWYSSKWRRYGGGTDRKEYPKFDRKRFSQKQLSQIQYYKGGSRNTYPIPRYLGALKDILTEIECSQYNLNSIKRGFLARYIINVPANGLLTDDDKKKIEDSIKSKFCGTRTDSNFMLYFAGGGLSGQSEKMEVSKIEVDDANERFIATKKDARENIYTAFRCTPNLFGLPTATTGFNSQEYASAFKLFQKTCIQPLQREIERSFEKIFGKRCLKIIPFEIDFEK